MALFYERQGRTVLFFVKVPDSVAGSFILTKLGFVLGVVELGILVPEFRFKNIHWGIGRVSTAISAERMRTDRRLWHRMLYPGFDHHGEHRAF